MTCSICVGEHHIACISLYESNDVVICNSCYELHYLEDCDDGDEDVVVVMLYQSVLMLLVK